MNDFHFILQCITTKQYSLSTRILYRPSSSCAPRQYCRMLFVYYVLFIHLHTSLFLLALSRFVVALSMVVTMVGGMVFLLFCFMNVRPSSAFCHDMVFSVSMLRIFFCFRFGSVLVLFSITSNKDPDTMKKIGAANHFSLLFPNRRKMINE